MYGKNDPVQLSFDDIGVPFGGLLDEENRWIKLSRKIPWDKIESIYEKNFPSDKGRVSYNSRFAFGTIYIGTIEGCSDERVIRFINENPYMQYFLGFRTFQVRIKLSQRSMMRFRKRFPDDIIERVNKYIESGEWNQDP